MSDRVFVIAEAACTWAYDDPMKSAQESIVNAKQAGADAWKTQWTSNAMAMAERRKSKADYSRLAWPLAWHQVFRAMCEANGLEYICTTFLPQDMCELAKYAKTAKISAFESGDEELLKHAHSHYKRVIRSISPGSGPALWPGADKLHCISKYPAALEDMKLGDALRSGVFAGLSDHTTSTLTGAVAVGCGARILEKHIRLFSTPESDPDFPHSLVVDSDADFSFAKYVRNVREAERML